jgi:HEAT repeat protein
VQEQVLPKAFEVLTDKINHGEAKTRADAIDLLGYIGDKTHIPMLAEIARTHNDPRVSEAALSSAFGLARTNSERMDLLMGLAGRGSKVREDALLLLEAIPDRRAKPYAQFLNLKGDLGNYHGLVRLMHDMPDAHGQDMVFNEALKLASNNRSIRLLTELVDQSGPKEHKLAAFEAGLHLLESNPLQRNALALRTMQLQPALRQRALEILSINGDSSVIRGIEPYTRHSDGRTSQQARAALDAIQHREQLARWESAVVSGTPDMKLNAVSAMAEVVDSKTIKPLLHAYATGNAEVQARAAAALQNYSPVLVKFEARSIGHGNAQMRARLAHVIDRVSLFSAKPDETVGTTYPSKT